MKTDKKKFNYTAYLFIAPYVILFFVFIEFDVDYHIFVQ